jgi:hypothetical protein
VRATFHPGATNFRTVGAAASRGVATAQYSTSPALARATTRIPTALAAGWHTNDAVVDLEGTGGGLRDLLGTCPHTSLHVIPASVTMSLATDTATPSGAMATPMCSARAELILASKSLSARSERDVEVFWNLESWANWQIALTQASTDNRSVLSTMW